MLPPPQAADGSCPRTRKFLISCCVSGLVAVIASMADFSKGGSFDVGQAAAASIALPAGCARIWQYSNFAARRWSDQPRH